MPSAPDLSALVRKARPRRFTSVLRLPAKDTLLDASSLTLTRADKVLLDTNIYIHDLAGRLPPAVAAILDAATLHHCSVCLGEIAVGLAARDVVDAAWPKELRKWNELFASMMPRRIHAPDRDVWIEAGLLAGILARIQHYSDKDRRKRFNDALVYLTARKAGLPVLTENWKDFWRLQQIAPGGTVYFCL